MTACTHQGRHWVLWNHTSGVDELGKDTFIWQHFETALIHADEEYSERQIPVVRELIERAKKLHRGQPMEVDDYELARGAVT